MLNNTEKGVYIYIYKTLSTYEHRFAMHFIQLSFIRNYYSCWMKLVEQASRLNGCGVPTLLEGQKYDVQSVSCHLLTIKDMKNVLK